MSVTNIRRELSDKLPIYTIIEDALAGEVTVKSKGKNYLPEPMTHDTSSTERYASYLARAVYYNVIKPTQEALVGQLFLRKPKVNLPELMTGMEKDVNGEGLDIEQIIRLAANHVLPYGRGGFLADFPMQQAEVTRADIDNGLQPTVTFYAPWAITNWRVTKVGKKQKLTLLVLKEVYETRESGDEFSTDLKDRYRVYTLDAGVVTLRVWEDEEKLVSNTLLKDSDGNTFDTIPFEFIGSENNDAEIDEPPLYGLASLNIHHYRNSADYEESVFLVGQPTPVYSGLTQDWVDNNFKGGVPFGSRASIPLPENGKAILLQAEPNTLAYEAMTHKEEQMIAIGAKIINPRQTVERKEAEIQIEAASQRSVLTTIKDNLQKAMILALQHAAKFVGSNPEEIDLELNDNFDLTSMTAEEIRWLIELYNGKLVPFGTVHENLRRSGIVKNTAEESKAEILADLDFVKSVTPVDPNPKPAPAANQKA